MKKINGKKISLCSNAQDRMRRFACLQDCLLTLTCHLANVLDYFLAFVLDSSVFYNDLPPLIY